MRLLLDAKRWRGKLQVKSQNSNWSYLHQKCNCRVLQPYWRFAVRFAQAFGLPKAHWTPFLFNYWFPVNQVYRCDIGPIAWNDIVFANRKDSETILFLHRYEATILFLDAINLVYWVGMAFARLPHLLFQSSAARMIRQILMSLTVRAHYTLLPQSTLKVYTRKKNAAYLLLDLLVSRKKLVKLAV